METNKNAIHLHTVDATALGGWPSTGCSPTLLLSSPPSSSPVPIAFMPSSSPVPIAFMPLSVPFDAPPHAQAFQEAQAKTPMPWALWPPFTYGPLPWEVINTHGKSEWVNIYTKQFTKSLVDCMLWREYLYPNGFIIPSWLSSKEPTCQCRRLRFDPWGWEGSPGEGNGNPL